MFGGGSPLLVRCQSLASPSSFRQSRLTDLLWPPRSNVKEATAVLDQRANHSTANVWSISQHPAPVDEDLKHVRDLLIWFPLRFDDW